MTKTRTPNRYLQNIESGELKKIVDNFESEYGYLTNIGNVFYFKTNLDATRNRIISIDIETLKIVEVVKETSDVLESCGVMKGEDGLTSCLGVRRVRAFSSRIFLSQCILIISHFHVSITSEESLSLIPQEKLEKKSSLEYELDYDVNSDTNARTQVLERLQKRNEDSKTQWRRKWRGGSQIGESRKYRYDSNETKLRHDVLQLYKFSVSRYYL